MLDAKRAVKTIAAALRADLPKTLEAVRLADDDVGERMMNADLSERLNQAERDADRPWQPEAWNKHRASDVACLLWEVSQ